MKRAPLVQWAKPLCSSTPHGIVGYGHLVALGLPAWRAQGERAGETALESALKHACQACGLDGLRECQRGGLHARPGSLRSGGVDRPSQAQGSRVFAHACTVGHASGVRRPLAAHPGGRATLPRLTAPAPAPGLPSGTARPLFAHVTCKAADTESAARRTPLCAWYHVAPLRRAARAVAPRVLLLPTRKQDAQTKLPAAVNNARAGRLCS